MEYCCHIRTEDETAIYNLDKYQYRLKCLLGHFLPSVGPFQQKQRPNHVTHLSLFPSQMFWSVQNMHTFTSRWTPATSKETNQSLFFPHSEYRWLIEAWSRIDIALVIVREPVLQRDTAVNCKYNETVPLNQIFIFSVNPHNNCYFAICIILSFIVFAIYQLLAGYFKQENNF